MGVTEELEGIAAMVTVSGPDPKGMKAERVPFHAAARDGTTTLSVSGLVMPSPDGASQSSCIVLCPAHAVLLFTIQVQISQQSHSQAVQADLLPGTRRAANTKDAKYLSCLMSGPVSSRSWHIHMIEVAMRGLTSSAKLLATFVCSEASGIIKAISAGSGDWSMGWQSNPAAHIPEMAILSCPLPSRDARLRIQHSAASLAGYRKGTSFTAMGSPFGALAPAHFLNHSAAGVISNVLRLTEPDEPGLLLADMHCLPGMEGGPVMSACGKLLGVLSQPLCSQFFKAEVPVVIPYGALMRAFRARPNSAAPGIHSSPLALPSAIAQQGLSDWSRRLAQMRSLPPPWQTVSVTPSLITQQASAPLSPPAAGASSTGSLSLAQHHSHAPSLQRTHIQSSAPPLAERLEQQPRQRFSQPLASASQLSATQDAHCAAPGEGLHGSPSIVSRRPQKHAQRMQMLGNHLSASEEPAHRSLNPSQLGTDLPAQLQHCSTAARPLQQELHSAPQIPGVGRRPTATLAEAVAAAEGSVVALMSSNGSWASGIVVSAAHGYILTVAHLLSERSQPPAQQPGQHSQPVSTQPSRAVHYHSSTCSNSQEVPETINPRVGPGKHGIRQHECRSAKQERQRGDVLVQIEAPEHTGITSSKGKEHGSRLRRSRKREGSKQLLWTTASLVYCFQGPLDIAVLQLDDLLLSSALRDIMLRPAELDAVGQGERVAVMGFPLLSPRLGFGSCATAGIIAKVLRVEANVGSPVPGKAGEECMFMTGASVHPGASGGAVIDGAGHLLGLVTSNTKHTATGHSLARLNYSLPAAALRPLWSLLRASPSADMEAIRQLDADSPALRRVWPLSSRLSPDTGSDGATERLQRLLRDKSIELAGHAQ